MRTATAVLLSALGQGGGDRNPPHAPEAAQRKLHADEIEQQQDAEFGQNLDLFAAADELQPRWAENDPREDIADDGGLPEARHRHAAYNGGQNDDGDSGKFERAFHGA
jgi:hypothetical protein